MLRRRSFTVLLILVGLALLISAPSEQDHTTYAQPAYQDDVCGTMIEEALLVVANNCINLGRNEICYGHEQVSATLNDDTLFFDAPGDIVPVTAIEALFTRPLDPDSGEWGIAVMDIQADLPTASDSVRILVFGGVELEPDTSMVTEDVPTCQFTNTGIANTNLRAGPDSIYSIVDVLDRDDTVVVYGRSADDAWLRSSRGWIAAEDGTLECDAGIELVEMNDSEDTFVAPMQAFTLQVDEAARCQAAPSGLLIQSPTGQTANIMVNNIEMRVGSTAFVSVDETTGCETIANIDGHVDVTSVSMPLPVGSQVTTAFQTGADCGTLEARPMDENLRLMDEGLLDAMPEPVDIPDAWQPVPPSASLTATETEIMVGECTTLNWTTENANDVLLDGVIVPPNGSQEVCPGQTTTYELFAESLSTEFPPTTTQATIEVVSPPPPPTPTISFSANPTTIQLGACTTLSWQIINAAAASLDSGGFQGIPLVGSMPVCPGVPGDHLYALQVTGLDGVVYGATTQVSVSAPPTVQFSFAASPATISVGQCSTLTWSTIYAQSVMVDSGSGLGPAETNGMLPVCPPTPGTYDFSMRVEDMVGDVHMAFASITVESAFSMVFTALPPELYIDEVTEVTLAWTVTGATLVELDDGSGFSPVAPSGSTFVYPSEPGTYTYTLRATDTGGGIHTATASVDVYAMPYIIFSANPVDLFPEESTTLSWEVYDAILVELDTGSGFQVVGASGSTLVTPWDYGDHTYTLRATGALGDYYFATVTVTVLTPQ